MIVRKLSDAVGTQRDVRTTSWRSLRLILAEDGMGFSFHVTTIDAGSSIEMQYRNHLESVYCIEGQGAIEDLGRGIRHDIEPGIVYALDQHDRHRLHATTKLVLACVFNPPLQGREVHDRSGSYPAAQIGSVDEGSRGTPVSAAPAAPPERH
ncbi:MAG: ectoine synthase [Deltaproteobacteria bacterium]|nr:ectoine synthase [Deltaproteobacteria bacterium]